MSKNLSLSTIAFAFALMALPAAHAATISKDEYKAGKSRISDTYKSDKAACASLKANAKDICVEQAKGKEKVAKAELEYSYTGKPKDAIKIQEARAESTYAVAKEKCDDLSGNPKDVCVKEAKAAKVRGMADAKLGKTIGEARTEAKEDVRDADYKVAIEKCDALAGDPKASCVKAAKNKYGKT